MSSRHMFFFAPKDRPKSQIENNKSHYSNVFCGFITFFQRTTKNLEVVIEHYKCNIQETRNNLAQTVARISFSL
jgi:hypothetical protein